VPYLNRQDVARLQRLLPFQLLAAETWESDYSEDRCGGIRYTQPGYLRGGIFAPLWTIVFVSFKGEDGIQRGESPGELTIH
jgi:hypothetical protein